MDERPEVTVVNAVRSEPLALPAGPLSLCAALEARGFRVEFADYQAWDGPGLGDPARFAVWLARSAPVLGLSVYSSSLPLTLAAAPLLKESRPDRLLVLGGPGTTGVESLLLQRFPALDIVVHGEGDDTLVEILEARRDARALADVPGLSYRHAGAIRTTAARPRITPLDRLPTPAYHLADLSPYRQERAQGYTPFGVFLSRGCAFHCSFCAIPDLWHDEARARSLGAVIDELRLLKERYGVDSFRILDDTFTLDRNRVLAFCERLVASGLNLPWVCHGRVDLVDEALIASLKDAGCRRIFYGLESGSAKVLRRLGKTFSVGLALDVVTMSRRYLEVDVSFMWGFPFESLEDLYDTLVVLLVAHETGAKTRLAWYVPFPATALSREFAGMVSRTLRHEVFPTRSHMDAYPYGEDLLAVVNANPDICSSYFFLDYPGLSEKLDYLRHWTLDYLASGAAEPGEAAQPPTRPECEWASDGLPRVRRSCSVRVIGHRRFVFDAARPRAFRISPFAEGIFLACQGREASDTLVSDLAARYGRGRDEVRTAVGHVLDRFAAEGMLCNDADGAG